MRAGIARLNCSPFFAIACDNVFNLTQPVVERLTPAVVILFLGLLAAQLFTPRDAFKVAMTCDDLAATVRV